MKGSFSGRSRHWLALVASLVLLHGCGWPMDPVPVRTLDFGGNVKRADTGAPVAEAQVEIWLSVPEKVGTAAPFVQGQTDASGTFALEGRDRNRAIPPDATVRITPPAGSGLATRTFGGYIGDIFPEITRTGDEALRYRTTVLLEPAPAP